MKPIQPPPHTFDPDRFLRCQEALADSVSDVALAAIKAGWQAEEVAAALVELADNIMLGMIANRQVAIDLASLERK
ncbi:hypothetical protein [Neorhizobium sp. NCHU2750]|uniref:hypothetical protein n=1 Tax=Neorhizobium sp. NCHU2750 TaxID=1825976 RepID=UPI000E70B8D4|nr:hypothetical protein NCHU2750_58860 [Neorhizobium sp. NCHU2750]